MKFIKSNIHLFKLRFLFNYISDLFIFVCVDKLTVPGLKYFLFCDHERIHKIAASLHIT